MEHGAAIPYFRELVVFLAAAGIVVPIFQRLHVSPVLGFLLIGLLIGPFGLAQFSDVLPALAWITIGDIEGVRLLAEFGVIFLLFMIGLELSFARLWQMKRRVFGLGMAQVLLTALAIGFIAAWFGNAAPAAIILGACLSLSSTAIVMQLLIERRRAATPTGRTSLAILLMQDLAVVPLLFVVGAIGGLDRAAGPAQLALQLGETVLFAALTVGIIAVAGRRLLGPLFRSVGAGKSPELFMALTLLVVIGLAAATGAAGMSMALGAFLAGLLLAESEYRHAIEVTIEPFKGLLLGLFFISVGMGIDLRVAMDEAFWILASVVGLFALKAAIIFVLALIFGESRPVALETALLLGQGGEFAFIVVGLSERLELLEGPVVQFMLLVTSLSMLATPLVARLAQRLARRSDSRAADNHHGVATAEEHEGHVLIAGFGRVGQIVAGLLDDQEIPWLALDYNSGNVAEQRQRNRPVYFGDAGRPELLERLGTQKALALVITLDDAAATAHLVATAHLAWPKLPVFVRARDRLHAEQLHRLGAAGVVAETVESSLQLGGMALQAAGLPDDAVVGLLDRQRSALSARAEPPRASS